MLTKFLKAGVVAYLVTFASNVFASAVDESIIQTVAVNFMENKTGKEAVISEIVNEEYNGKKSVYGINFEGGGWVIVSSRDELWPILGYNTTGRYESRKNSENTAFNAMIDNFGQTVYAIDSIADDSSDSSFLGSSNQLAYATSPGEQAKNDEKRKIENKWMSLASGESLRSYTPGRNLIKDERGENLWSQKMTNDGLAFYNTDCPYDPNNECRSLVGCPALSLSQVMWKWRWPDFAENSQGGYLTSQNIRIYFNLRFDPTRGVVSYDGFDWDLIPNKLNRNSTNEQVKETSHLLRQVGEALHIYYGCEESGLYNNESYDLYRHALGELGYNNYAVVVATSDGKMVDKWYDQHWNDLIKTEIDAERPVLYQCFGLNDGDTTSSGHVFVVAGYDADEDYLFYCNLGWGGKCNGYYKIVRNDNHYKILSGSYQGAVVGISPKYPTERGDVYLGFDGVYEEQTRGKNAMENIVVPAPEKSGFTVETGGKLQLRAGKKISLKSGFSVKDGAKFGARIVPEFSKDHLISVTLKENTSGSKGKLSFDVKNANSWYLTIKNKDSTVFTHASGVIGSDGEVVVWSGNRYVTNESFFEITFLNNFGQDTTYVGKFEERVLVYVEEPSPAAWFDMLRPHDNKEWMALSSSNGGSSNSNNDGNMTTDLEEEMSSSDGIALYPNPTTGLLYIRAAEESTIVETVVMEITGKVLLRKTGSSNEVDVDLSSLTKGVYLVKVVTSEDTYVEKVVLR